MPNQRAKNKKVISVPMDLALIKKVEALAASQKIRRSQAIVMICEDYLLKKKR